MAIHKPHMPFSYIMPQANTPTGKLLNPDDVDVSALNCDEFVVWLNAKQFSPEHCEAFRGVSITS